MHPGYIRRYLTKDLFQTFFQLVATFLCQFQQLWQQSLLRRRGRRGHLGRPARQPWGKGPRPWEHRRRPQQQTKAHYPCERSPRMCHGHGWKWKLFGIVKNLVIKIWVLTVGGCEADSKSHRESEVTASLVVMACCCWYTFPYSTKSSTVWYFKSEWKMRWIWTFLALNWNHVANKPRSLDKTWREVVIVKKPQALQG